MSSASSTYTRRGSWPSSILSCTRSFSVSSGRRHGIKKKVPTSTTSMTTRCVCSELTSSKEWLDSMRQKFVTQRCKLITSRRNRSPSRWRSLSTIQWRSHPSNWSHLRRSPLRRWMSKLIYLQRGNRQSWVSSRFMSQMTWTKSLRRWWSNKSSNHKSRKSQRRSKWNLRLFNALSYASQWKNSWLRRCCQRRCCQRRCCQLRRTHRSPRNLS